MAGVAAFDSHFFRAPSFSLTGSPRRRRRMLFPFANFHSRLLRTGGPGPVSLNRSIDAPGIDFAAAWPEPPTGNFGPMHSTPQRKPRHVFRACFRPVFSAPEIPEFWADKPFTRCLDRPGGVVISDPLGSTGGDPNTLAPNRLKARTTPLRPSRTSTSS